MTNTALAAALQRLEQDAIELDRAENAGASFGTTFRASLDETQQRGFAALREIAASLRAKRSPLSAVIHKQPRPRTALAAASAQKPDLYAMAWGKDAAAADAAPTPAPAVARALTDDELYEKAWSATETSDATDLLYDAAWGAREAVDRAWRVSPVSSPKRLQAS